MTRKGILIASIARVFLIFCMLVVYVYALPASGQSLISVTSREQFRDGTELQRANAHVASAMRDSVKSKHSRALAGRLLADTGVLNRLAAEAGSPKVNPRTETGSMITIERKVKDAQLTIQATAVIENIRVEGDKFQVPPGDAVAWEIELSVYNMRASTGWRYWDATLEFGSELAVEAVDSPGTIDPVPEGGSPIEPRLTIMRDEKTRKTKVVWSWHSLEDNTSSDFPKRAKAKVVLRVYSPESGFKQGIFVFCDNARITYMTGAKRPKETTYELESIVVNVTFL